MLSRGGRFLASAARVLVGLALLVLALAILPLIWMVPQWLDDRSDAE